MGHLTRQTAVALALQDRADVVILSLSSGIPVVLDQGLRAEYLPSYQRPWMPRSDWHRYLRDRVVALATEVGATVVAFDGVAPYRGLVLARKALPGTAFVWFRRGLWRPGANLKALRAEPFFDLVIEPGDFAAVADRGATARRPAGRIAPVSVLDVLSANDRTAAAQSLGLDPSRPTALITLGSGASGRGDELVDAAVTALREDRSQQWQIATTQAALHEGGDVPDGVHVVRGIHPLAVHLSAFDLVITAAGYNAVHEFVAAAVPTVLVPNAGTATDDQVARAEQLSRDGLAVMATDSASLADAVQTLLDPGQRSAMRDRIRSHELPGGGAQGAAELLLTARAQAPTQALRLRRMRYLARAAVVDAVMRVVGEGISERLRQRRRAGRPGLTHRLRVRLVREETGGRERSVLVNSQLNFALVRREDPFEHVLAGTSEAYLQTRMDIVRRAYDVETG